MGSACCAAAKDQTTSNRSGGETLHRNVLYSPSWSVQVDNREHMACEIEGPSSQPSHRASRHVSMDMKGSFGLERDRYSYVENQFNIGALASQKSSEHDGIAQNAVTLPSDPSSADNHSTEAKSSTGSPEIPASCAPKLSFSVPSTTVSTPATDPLPIQAFAVTTGSTPSRRARRSPGHQLLRQVSDSRILGLKSPNNNSVSEGRPSFVLSACSNDLATRSQGGGSSDGWSMRMFSELVASSQRERWSFDSEAFGSGHSKICGSSSLFSCSPSTDPRTCEVCSKPLAYWVVAVLVCGHVYHADCLEGMTLEANKYDPACPVCVVGEKQVLKLSRKRGEAESKGRNGKISRSRVVDSYFDGDDDMCTRRGKALAVEPCSSTKTSFVKPFLRRHFSLGSKWGKSLSLTENDPSRRKGFWARSRKE